MAWQKLRAAFILLATLLTIGLPAEQVAAAADVARNLILYLYHINSRNDLPHPSWEEKRTTQSTILGSQKSSGVQVNGARNKTIFVMVK